MSSPTQILMNATSSDGPTRNQAEQQLKSAAQNLQQFLEGLVSVIIDEQQPEPARQMAAIVLKNTVAVRSKDVVKKANLEEQWRNIDEAARGKLKGDILFGLGSQNKQVRFVVALLVANLARIEVPVRQWDDLIPKLTEVCQNGDDTYAEAALLALGYICEETEESDALDNAMQNFSRPILDAIFNSMGRQNPMVIYSATRCLVHSLNFIHHHMGKDSERSYIVKCLCDQSTSSDRRTRERAMEGIVRLADLYYHLLPQYMDQLNSVTTTAIQNHANDNEQAAYFAARFWGEVCGTEADMDPQEADFKGIVQRYKQSIFDTMWNALQCQEEGQTNEDNNLSVTASKVIVNMARALGNDILPLAMDTAMNNVTANKWRVQDAAIVLFGCILPAPEPHLIQNQVSDAIPPLTGICVSGHEFVKDSAAWVLGQIAGFFPELMLGPNVFGNIFETVKALLNINAQLAERGLTILHNLAVDVDERYNQADHFDNNGNKIPRPNSNEFSRNFSELVGSLGSILDAQSAPDNVRAIAQETLNLVIHAAADDVLNVLHSMIPILCGKINDFVALRKQQGSTAYLNTQIALLCGAITAITRKLGPAMNQHSSVVLPAIHATLEVPPSREQSILSNNNKIDYEEEEQATTMAGVESVICVSALILALGDNMWPHLGQFTPFLLGSIKQTEDEDLYTAALGVIGDIASLFGPRSNQLLMFDALGLLRDQLHSEDTPITVKPDILKCVGDVALYYGQAFSDFSGSFLKIAADLDAAGRNQDLSDEETRTNVIELFSGIAKLNSQIIQGMKENPQPIINHLPWMVRFAEEVGLKFNTADPELLEDICGLIGDIASCMKDAPPEILSGAQQALGTDGIRRLLRGAGEFDQVITLVETAQWAMKQISKLMNRRR